MKYSAVFLLAMAVAVANTRAASVQPYVVPVYRATVTASTGSTTSTGSTASTTPTTTPTTTTLSTSTVPTTTPKPTIPAVRGDRGNLRAVTGLTLDHVCSGTLVSDTAVITTVTCIELAMTGTAEHAYVGTALDTSSADSADKVYYEVTDVVKHPQYAATTNANNVAVLKLARQVDFTMASKVSAIQWSLAVPAAEAACVTSYWSADTPFAQVNKDVTVKACTGTVTGAVCSDYATPPAVCPSGANGGSLVCDSKLAGVFTAYRNTDCSAALWQYQEISKDAAWIEANVSSAAILNVSFAAILALVTAMLKSL